MCIVRENDKEILCILKICCSVSVCWWRLINLYLNFRDQNDKENVKKLSSEDHQNLKIRMLIGKEEENDDDERHTNAKINDTIHIST